MVGDGGQAARERVSTAWRLWFAASMVVVALAGAVNVPLPFTGDEALYTLGARELSHGAVMYRDFWDFKPPGIYWFYEAGSALLGFTEVGQHTWELLWWLAFAAFLAYVLRGRLRHPLLAALAPLVVAAYLLVLRPNDLGQVEDLLAIPLFVSMWAVDDSRGPLPRWRWFVSGVAGAIVVLLKHPFAIIPLAFWLRAFVRAKRRDDRFDVRAAGALVLGFVVPLVPVVVYFAATRQWGNVWWTYVEYAPKTSSIDVRPFSRFRAGAGHVLGDQLPFFALGIVAVVAQLRGRRRPFVTELVVWLVLAVPVVLAGLWWPYHFLVFEIPLMVLALFGLDELVGRLSRRQTYAAALAGLVLLAPMARDGEHKVKEAARHDFGLTVDGRRSLRELYESDYARAPQLTAFLRQPGARPGDIYVLGNPLFQLQSGRGQAISYNGWNADVSNRELFRRTRDELAQKRPPYVFVDVAARQLISERSPELDQFLAQQYHELQRSDVGTWYESNS